MAERKNWVTGVKGFACLMVMVGHLLDVYNKAEMFNPNMGYLDIFVKTGISFLFDPSFWLYLFFIISGYLIAFSKITSIKTLIGKTVQRFLRLGLPILFVHLIILVIYKTLGFHNTETVSLFTNEWMQGFYAGQSSITDFLISPIKVLIFKDASLNAPYWVLGDMFIASVITYVLTFIKSKVKKKTVFSVIFLAVFALSFALSAIVTACLLGSAITYFEKETQSDNKTQLAMAVFIIAAIAINGLDPKYLRAISFAIVVIFIPRVKIFTKIFSSKLFEWLGNLSWGVYSFHWPIMCSLGSIIILNMNGKIGLPFAYLLSCAVTVVCVFIVSIPYYFTFEKLTTLVCKQVNKLIYK